MQEFARILTSADRVVSTQQRDPSMGPNARLDIVEATSDVGTAAAYDLSVVTPLRVDAGFCVACALEPGYAANQRHIY